MRVHLTPLGLLAKSARPRCRRRSGAEGAAISAGIGATAIVFFALVPTFVITTIAGRAFAPGAPLVVPYVYAIAMLALANIVATYAIARGRMRFVILLLVVGAGEVIAILVRHRSAADFL